MKKTLYLACLFIIAFLFQSFTSDDDISWIKKAYYGGGVICGASSFTIDNYAYVCSGVPDILSCSKTKYTVYRYDPTNDVWKRMADLPTTAKGRENAVGFAVNGRGYICGGSFEDFYGKNYFPTNTWEFNPSTNLWYQRANFPRAGGMWMGIGFTIDSVGYAGLGWAGFTTLDNPSGEMNDFYKFDPKQNKWTKLNDFPGSPRSDAVGFSMNGKGYVGLGDIINDNYTMTYFQDFWEYDPIKDDWTRLPDFPGEGRSSAIGYGINGYCYVGLGNINDFYKYNVTKKQWISLNYLSGAVRGWPISFCIDSSIFYGCGDLGSYTESDLWEYTTASSSTDVKLLTIDSKMIYPNPATDIIYLKGIKENSTINIYDINGTLRLTKLIGRDNSLDISHLYKGIYLVNITTSDFTKQCKLIKN
jgi:N-acetylneuraminic acid mutarotase